MEKDQARRGWARWELIVGFLTIVSLVTSSGLGQRLPMIVQDAAFLFLISLPLVLTSMSWAGFTGARLDPNIPRWRVWLSLCGCVALSLALATPLAVIFGSMFFRLSWLQLGTWCLGCSGVALLMGVVAPRSMRFPLFFGGLVMGGLVLIVPVGV